LEIVVGLPLSLSGGDTPSTADARAFAGELAARTTVPVRLVDERLSTVSAQRELHRSGRSARTSRAVIDQVAAVIILQNALDSERAAGRPPGAPVDPDERT
ncbi:Holliday junction resolvase RuvX, partial [Mesorhizobium japonicum]|uniref:Holliday junction resolvase RuvX n=1 Tax=Mesorhizobium japonicum TaxID=2066070 RepID=UPI003B5B5CAE